MLGQAITQPVRCCAVLLPPGQRYRTVCLNSFGNWTLPSDNSNDRWKHLCLVSWSAAPCVWTLRVLTRNLLTYLLTCLCIVKCTVVRWTGWQSQASHWATVSHRSMLRRDGEVCKIWDDSWRHESSAAAAQTTDWVCLPSPLSSSSSSSSSSSASWHLPRPNPSHALHQVTKKIYTLCLKSKICHSLSETNMLSADA